MHPMMSCRAGASLGLRHACHMREPRTQHVLNCHMHEPRTQHVLNCIAHILP